MRYFVTGCAGFIASHLVDRLLALGHEVVGYDNLVTGRVEFLIQARKNPYFKFNQYDVLDFQNLLASMPAACDAVFHFAANADVRGGINHTDKDLKQNTIATFNVLEAMRIKAIKRIIFPSTGSIYGEAPLIPTPEDAPFPIQTSLYGASKLAAEGLIQAYCEAFAMQSYIFRFVSILGERYTHGHVFDFYKQLYSDPSLLKILGDGEQKKSYLYIHDCIDAMFIALEKAHEKINIFNLGTDHYCQVNDSIRWICKALGLSPQLDYRGGKRGWIGDNPFIFLDCRKIRGLGWEPKLRIEEAIVKTVDDLVSNSHCMEAKV
ncbi:NAD-dependent epimerase/dehydratase family protein [Rickettsiella endosymbiont of Dermanyssus gallinae]|uniref:NAD-dependent epimerase/dehydratase family protein n=1 Tax=Rickettsiella endosymbiont of Dermanyssus gallinae TaxID=2856608 RepID=UPI001C52FD0C|nr:NAD-dependent epimerase/dehydratase family protein [Rickettsiella endosymbiont of Dermanyssus gallinae]